MTDIAAPLALTTQFLAWLAEKPRSYGETMEAWRTSCPRLSVWEDAVGERLVEVQPAPGGGMNAARVLLTGRGRDLLERNGRP